MRNRIDNLILINLLWFVIDSCGVLFHASIFTFVAIIGALANLAYDYNLMDQIEKTIEEQYRAHLNKRILRNMLFSFVFAILTLLKYFF